jgi:hypothetical protein
MQRPSCTSKVERCEQSRTPRSFRESPGPDRIGP